MHLPLKYKQFMLLECFGKAGKVLEEGCDLWLFKLLHLVKGELLFHFHLHLIDLAPRLDQSVPGFSISAWDLICKALYFPSAPQRLKLYRSEELWWQHSSCAGRSMRESWEPPWCLLPFLLPVSGWFAVSTAPSSSSGCCHQLGWEGSRHRQRRLCWEQEERGGHTMLSYCDLLSYFSFSQPLLAGRSSSRSWQLQEVRQKLWAEPSKGRSLSPETAHGGSANRM